MAIILISPTASSDSSDERVQLQVIVKSEDFEDLFDQLEVWRSRSGVSGPYEELTASAYKAARVPASAADVPATPVTGASAVLAGKTLALTVGQENLVITLTGPDPETFAAAAAEVTAQGLGKVHAYVDPTGTFVVESMLTGTAATLTVTGGEAAPILGLSVISPDNYGFGRDARISLRSGAEEYAFVDYHGSPTYSYKIRLRNRLNGSYSEFSDAFSVNHGLGISSTNVVVGQLDLVDVDGTPLANVGVVISNAFRGDLVEGKLVAGTSQEKFTDTNGHVEFFLVRGSKVTVSVSGTNIVRDIVVPTDPSVKVFPLLGTDTTQDDTFKVNIPNIIYAERRSL